MQDRGRSVLDLPLSTACSNGCRVADYSWSLPRHRDGVVLLRWLGVLHSSPVVRRGVLHRSKSFRLPWSDPPLHPRSVSTSSSGSDDPPLYPRTFLLPSASHPSPIPRVPILNPIPLAPSTGFRRCVCAVVINICAFALIGRAGPVAYEVVGHAKTIIVVVAGFLFFSTHTSQVADAVASSSRLQ